MKFIPFLFIFLLNTTFTFSQIQGKISNATTKEPIPFVNIGITKLAKGTVSDDFGNYELEATAPTDTVTISAIGFSTQKKTVKALLENGNILLQQKIHEIKTVNLTATEFGNEKRFGKKNKNRGLSVGFGNRQLGCAIGSKISIKKETYLKSANFKINHAEGDSLLFRVNIFHFEDGVVGENILKKNIILSMPQKRGILTVDLTPYELIIDHDVLLSLESVSYTHLTLPTTPYV